MHFILLYAQRVNLHRIMKNITHSLLMGFLLVAGMSHAQIRMANSNEITAVNNSSAFIDASSNLEYNNSTNIGKGLLYPRTDLSTFTAFGGAPIGIPSSFPTRYDGFVVYNTKEGGVAGVGTTQGTLTAGFWYYDNKSGTINGGTWKPFTATSGGATTNVLSSSGNNIISNVNGISSTAPAVNSNTLSLTGSSLRSTVNGITSNSLNLGPAITAATTNVLALSGNNLTSTVNGVSSTANLSSLVTGSTTHTFNSSNNTMTSNVNGINRTASIVNSVSNSISGNNLITTVNGISSTSTTLPAGVNIYNANGTLLGDRTVTMGGNRIYFRQSSGNEIYFDAGASNSDTDIHLNSTRSTILRSAVGSSRLLDLEVMSNGSSRLLSTGSSELFVGTNTSSGPLVFGVSNHRVILATNGNFGIGLTNPSYKLHVAGDARANRFISGTTTYPDYVFENYYKGYSTINPDYKFKTLTEVEEFIKEKGHLPGYASIDEVKKNDMTVDITQNSITNMEKIEELYLHVIELNKQIKILQEKNAELEKMTTPLNNLDQQKIVNGAKR